LGCGSNQLTSLDVSYNTALASLECGSNQLSMLDVSKNIDLSWLECNNNLLTSLDVSNNTTLGVLQCSGNQFTSLDLSHNSDLGTFSTGFVEFDISQMPTLYKVCVWEMPFPPEGLEVDTIGSPNVYFTTECSK
jgi:Leucine-rich repeat (LRR) protein